MKTLFYFNIFTSVIVLVAVYILEYGFKMAPCEMCIIERYQYYSLIVLGIIGLLSIEKLGKVTQYLILCILTLGVFYTLYHVGIERSIFEGNSACSGSFSSIIDKETLLKNIEQAPLIRCDVATYLFNFISLAESNLIVTIMLLFSNLYLGFKK